MPTVLITGVSTGLGAALKRRFIAGGFKVFGTQLDASRKADVVSWDASRDSPDAIVSAFVGEHFDVVINNAGINAIRPFEELTQEFLADVIQVNAIAPVLLVRELLVRGRLPKGSVICNIVSDAAYKPMRHSAAYNMSKAALAIATQQMARELTKPHHLTIFGVCPGKMFGTTMSAYIDKQVEQVRGWTKREAMEYFTANSVTGRESAPESLADTIHHLCVSATSRTLSGAMIPLVG